MKSFFEVKTSVIKNIPGLKPIDMVFQKIGTYGHPFGMARHSFDSHREHEHMNGCKRRPF